ARSSRSAWPDPHAAGRAGRPACPPARVRRRADAMILRHATPARNLNSILRSGLLCSCSRGKLPAVWLVTPSKSSWAVLHVIKRHGGEVETTIVLEVDVPRGWLKRSRGGLRYILRDLPPERIVRVLCFSELAGTSTKAA